MEILFFTSNSLFWQIYFLATFYFYVSGNYQQNVQEQNSNVVFDSKDGGFITPKQDQNLNQNVNQEQNLNSNEVFDSKDGGFLTPQLNHKENLINNRIESNIVSQQSKNQNSQQNLNHQEKEKNLNSPQSFQNFPSEPEELTDETFNRTIKGYDLVFVNFYADWCPFSQMSNPIFTEAWKQLVDKLQKEAEIIKSAGDHMNEPRRTVMFARLNAELFPAVRDTAGITKYPTWRIYRLGAGRGEYRGQRDASAISAFIHAQLTYRVNAITSVSQLHALMRPYDHRHVPDVSRENKSAVVAILGDSSESAKKKNELTIKTLEMIGFLMRDDCNIFVARGPEYKSAVDATHAATKTADDVLFYRPAYEQTIEHFPSASPSADSNQLLDRMSEWIFRHCTPRIPEITRENAEELTERNKPLLILFYNPRRDVAAIETFKRIVMATILSADSPWADRIQPVYASSTVFAHPLHHMGKTDADLPLIAIDSFAHMFAFPHPFSALEPSAVPGHASHQLLVQFVADLFSEKLDREFHNSEHGHHHGNAPPPPSNVIHIDLGNVVVAPGNAQPDDAKTADYTGQQSTQKVESVFSKLKPSYTRYSMLEDEYSPRDEL